jgi:hypothetical protein
MQSREFQPGCRLSTIDVVVLLAAIIAAALAYGYQPWLSMTIVFVFGHFYLFCNVFRLSRLPELIWAALFLGLAISTMLADWPGWPTTFAVSAVATIFLIANEMRQPSYHGLWWETVNPGLPQWWEAQDAAAADAVAHDVNPSA